jgi:hypothetical protein
LEVALSDAANAASLSGQGASGGESSLVVPLAALAALPTEIVGGLGSTPAAAAAAMTADGSSPPPPPPPTQLQPEDNAAVIAAREVSWRVAKTWTKFFWKLDEEKQVFEPLSVDSRNGQTSETYPLNQLEWKEVSATISSSTRGKYEKVCGKRVAKYAVWVKPDRAGKVCITARVSYRPRKLHQWRVSSTCAFEVKIIDPLDMNLSFRSASLQPCGMRGKSDLRDDPTYQRKSSLLTQHTPTAVGALAGVLDQVKRERERDVYIRPYFVC